MPKNKTLFNGKYFCFWCFIMLNFPFILFAQVSTTLNQSFKIDMAESVSIQVNSPNLKVKYIQGSRILVETKISLSIDNSILLDLIVQKGRYDLIKKLDMNTKSIKLIPKNNHSLIVIKGKELEEQISYTIYIPKEMTYINLVNK